MNETLFYIYNLRLYFGSMIQAYHLLLSFQTSFVVIFNMSCQLHITFHFVSHYSEFGDYLFTSL